MSYLSNQSQYQSYSTSAYPSSNSNANANANANQHPGHLKHSHHWTVYPYWYMETYVKDWLDATERQPYKCIGGRDCHHELCEYLHPGQLGYRNASYYQSSIPCKYETDESACRLKCGLANGRYCPYLHCSHKKMEHIAIQCPRPDCQQHCPQCI